MAYDDGDLQLQGKLEIRPLQGHIVPVPTVQEIEPSIEFGDAYAVEIVQKCAAQVSKLFTTTFPKDSTLQFNHLRRFVKESFLPESLRERIDRERNLQFPTPTIGGSENDDDNAAVARPPVPTIFVLIQPPLPEMTLLKSALAPFVPSNYSLFSTPTATVSNLSDANNHKNNSVYLSSFPIYPLKIPLQPPLTQQQADKWSSTLWPTSFNAAFPRSLIAPPVKTLEATKTNIAPKAGYYLSLARKVAREAKQFKRGRAIGAVIVDPALASIGRSTSGGGDCSGSSSSTKTTTTTNNNNRNDPANGTKDFDSGIVAVAGDARYCAPGIVPLFSFSAEKENNDDEDRGADKEIIVKEDDADCEGGPEFHAIMRAIEMVAIRRRTAELLSPTVTTATTVTTVHGTSLTKLERYYLYRPLDPTHTAFSTTSPMQEPESIPESQTPPQSQIERIIDSAATSLPALNNNNNTSNNDHQQPTSRIAPRAAGGYLCTDLDIYITHEPCLTCSMGMLLSRFRAVTFPRTGRLRTGGLASRQVGRAGGGTEGQTETDTNTEKEKIEKEEKEDREVYYGLHWRKELNWRAMCFEFIDDDDDGDDADNEGERDDEDEVEGKGNYYA